MVTVYKISFLQSVWSCHGLTSVMGRWLSCFELLPPIGGPFIQGYNSSELAIGLLAKHIPGIWADISHWDFGPVRLLALQISLRSEGT